jgi:flagellar hook assembly protein FlgD
VTAEVFDLDGRVVRTLARDEEFPAGREDLRWDGRAAGDRPVPDGMYFLEVHAEAGSAVRRVLVIH